MSETTTVAVIGAGPAGLTLGNLLRQRGIACIVVERQRRSYVEQRQRAGVIEHRAAQMFKRWGLADEVLQDARMDGNLEFRVHGEARILPLARFTGGRAGLLVTQQMLVRRLVESLLAAGGDLRFEVSDVALHDLTKSRPRVTYRDSTGAPREIECDYVAGCDGFHGISRASVPEDALATYSYNPGIGWLTVLAETPPPRHPLFAVSSQGFAAQYSRGPNASRYIVQCPPTDGVEQWPDERVWAALRARLADDDLPTGPIVEKTVVDMRSFVLDPISYGRLFLVGDAAHIITPMGGKGMNLALHDADVLARAICSAVDGDEEPLRSYSETCLRLVWDYQEFSRWMTEMLHDSGDDSTVGAFRGRLARARLDRVFTSPAAATAFAEFMAGLDDRPAGLESLQLESLP